MPASKRASTLGEASGTGLSRKQQINCESTLASTCQQSSFVALSYMYYQQPLLTRMPKLRIGRSSRIQMLSSIRFTASFDFLSSSGVAWGKRLPQERSVSRHTHSSPQNASHTCDAGTLGNATPITPWLCPVSWNISRLRRLLNPSLA